jgi:hypothetical protein
MNYYTNTISSTRSFNDSFNENSYSFVGGTFSITPNAFNLTGNCNYCDTYSSQNLGFLTIYICAGCFKKALDSILTKSLNRRVIQALEDNNGESK